MAEARDRRRRDRNGKDDDNATAAKKGQDAIKNKRNAKNEEKTRKLTISERIELFKKEKL